MAVLSIRKVSEELAYQVRLEAAAAGVDIRVWVIEQLEAACGLRRKAVRSGRRARVRVESKGKGRIRRAAPEARAHQDDAQTDRGTVEPGLEDGRSSGEETNGALKQFTASGSPRCQSHDDTGWQCRLADGHGNTCF
jgi:hypothetical protein